MTDLHPGDDIIAVTIDLSAHRRSSSLGAKLRELAAGYVDSRATKLHILAGDADRLTRERDQWKENAEAPKGRELAALRALHREREQRDDVEARLDDSVRRLADLERDLDALRGTLAAEREQRDRAEAALKALRKTHFQQVKDLNRWKNIADARDGVLKNAVAAERSLQSANAYLLAKLHAVDELAGEWERADGLASVAATRLRAVLRKGAS